MTASQASQAPYPPGDSAPDLESLHELMSALSGVREVEPLLGLATAALVERFDVALARVWLLDESTGTLVLTASSGLSARTTTSPRYRIKADNYPFKLAQVVAAQEPVFSANLEADPQFETAWVQRESIRSFAGYPLLLGDRLLGVLVLFSRHVLSPQILATIRLLTHHLTATLAGAQLLDAEQRRTRQANELNHVSAALNSEQHLDRLLQMIADTGRALTGASSVAVLTESEARGKRGFAFAAASGVGAHDLPHVIVTEPHGLLVPLLRDGEVLRLSDMRADPRFENRHPQNIPVASMLGAPLTGRDGRIIGALLIGHESPDAFGEQQESLAVALARHASIAVENARLLRNAQLATGRVRALNEIGQALSAILNRQDLLSAIQRFVSETMDATSFAVVLWDEANQELQAITRMENGIEYGPATSPLGKGPVSQAIMTRKPCYIEHLDVEAPELVASMSWYGTDEVLTQAQLAVPMILGDRVIGALSVQSYEPYAYSPADVEVVSTIASQAAVALENVRLYEQLSASRQRLAGALEDLRQLDRQKDYFLSAASHELKTPLTVIQGQVQLIARYTSQNDDQSISRHIKAALRNVDRMGRLIEGLLDVSRLDTGNLRLRMATVDVAELARLVSESMHDLRSKGILVTSIPEGPVLVVGDIDRLEQVLLNLLSNAQVHGNPDGTRVLEVRAVGDKARISVSDQGEGIAPEDLDRVFERFFQSAADPEKQHSGGMGLGLYISRGIVEAHGGSIWVESQPGIGSTFTVELPLQR